MGNKIKSGDLVVRNSYNHDIIFKVKQIFKDEEGRLSAVLKGVAIRLIADAPMTDLEPLSYEQAQKILVEEEEKDFERVLALSRHDFRGEESNNFRFPGKVLHLDGDREYLDRCLEVYRKFRIPHEGLAVAEKDQPKAVTYYLEKYNPSILVITGHDSLLKGAKDYSNLDNYRSSSYFVDAVYAARRFQPDKDSLVIFAGACQSCYEELIAAGANFASSPKRVFIHLFDPVLIIERVAYTSIKKIITAEEAVNGTVTGSDGIGGIETRGLFRMGYPKGLFQ